MINIDKITQNKEITKIISVIIPSKKGIECIPLPET